MAYKAEFSSLLIHVRLKHYFHLVFIQAAFCWLYLPDGCLRDFSFYDYEYSFFPVLLEVALFVNKYDESVFLF